MRQESERGSQYSRFIVQSLISNHEWSSCLDGGRLYHVGTIPDKRGNIFVAARAPPQLSPFPSHRRIFPLLRVSSGARSC